MQCEYFVFFYLKNKQSNSNIQHPNDASKPDHFDKFTQFLTLYCWDLTNVLQCPATRWRHCSIELLALVTWVLFLYILSTWLMKSLLTDRISSARSAFSHTPQSLGCKLVVRCDTWDAGFSTLNSPFIPSPLPLWQWLDELWIKESHYPLLGMWQCWNTTHTNSSLHHSPIICLPDFYAAAWIPSDFFVCQNLSASRCVIPRGAAHVGPLIGSVSGPASRGNTVTDFLWLEKKTEKPEGPFSPSLSFFFSVFLLRHTAAEQLALSLLSQCDKKTNTRSLS